MLKIRNVVELNIIFLQASWAKLVVSTSLNKLVVFIGPNKLVVFSKKYQAQGMSVTTLGYFDGILLKS